MKVTKKNFLEEVSRFKRYFNDGIDNDYGRRSVYCIAGRLEIYTGIYRGKLYVSIYTHPVETAFESEVYHENFVTMDEAVSGLKKAETKYKKMKSWWN